MASQCWFRQQNHISAFFFILFVVHYQTRIMARVSFVVDVVAEIEICESKQYNNTWNWHGFLKSVRVELSKYTNTEINHSMYWHK